MTRRLFFLFVCFSSFCLAQNALLTPVIRSQFLDASGRPLAGGKIYTCTAGTTCPGNPLATYQDAAATVENANPIILNSGGFAQIRLANGSTYKFVAYDSNGVKQWSIDNVQNGVMSFDSLHSGTNTTGAMVCGSGCSITYTGNGTNNASTLNGVAGSSFLLTNLSNLDKITQSLLFSTDNTYDIGASAGNRPENIYAAGLVSSATSSTTGNASVGGNFSVAGTSTVTGALSAGALNVGGTSITDLISSVITNTGSPTTLNGTAVISNLSFVSVTNGSWEVFTFGTATGTRVKVAIGTGTAGNGATIPLPTGFSSTNMIGTASLGDVDTGGSGNNITTFHISVSNDTVTATAGDYSGHSYTVTANWTAIAWMTAQ
ncbi:MAG: hypothetical protein ACREHG_06320 [Candidatus Saccharimonadales bacterium]